MSWHSLKQHLQRVSVLALVALLVSNGASLAAVKTKDTTPPTAILTNVVLVNGAPAMSVPTGKAFSLMYMVKDDSFRAKLTFSLFSDGSLIRTVTSSGFIVATGTSALWPMQAVPVPKKGPSGIGPFYVCIAAQDGAGNRSLNFPKSVCEWLSIAVPIALVSNGCGKTLKSAALEKVQAWLLDEQTYGRVVVKFREACDFHDAGYSGVTVWDPTLKMMIDYRPWSRKMVDDEFRQNLEYLCDLYLGKDKVTSAQFARCSPGQSLIKYVASIVNPLAPLESVIPGALTYYDAVRKLAKSAFDTDPTKPGVQENNKPGTFPPGGGRDNS